MDSTNRQDARKGKEQPKHRLRYEREVRGWSRDYVANQVGSDVRTVGRWERGETLPSPYYRQALCELFGMKADALDLLRDGTQQQANGNGDQAQPPVEIEPLPDDQSQIEHPIERAPLPPVFSTLYMGQLSEKATFPLPSSPSLAEPSIYSPYPPYLSYPSSSPTKNMRMLASTMACSVGIFVLCLLIFTVFTWRVLPYTLSYLSSQNSNTSPSLKPGGMWVEPSDGQTVHGIGIINFVAKAYPTNPGDPLINHVNFTVGWKGGWRIACTIYPPTTDNLYACTISLSALKAPLGTIQISFDVYDQAGHINFAPNGLHQVLYISY